MTTNPEKRRRVTLPYTGYIPLIRRSGPVAQPISLPESVCFKLVSRGFNVYENGRKLTTMDFISGNGSAPVIPNKKVVTKKPEVKPTEKVVEKKVATTPVVEATKVEETPVEVVEAPVETETIAVQEEVPSVEVQVIEPTEKRLSKKERRRLEKERLAKESVENTEAVNKVATTEETPVTTEEKTE